MIMQMMQDANPHFTYFTDLKISLTSLNIDYSAQKVELKYKYINWFLLF